METHKFVSLNILSVLAHTRYKNSYCFLTTQRQHSQLLEHNNYFFLLFNISLRKGKKKKSKYIPLFAFFSEEFFFSFRFYSLFFFLVLFTVHCSIHTNDYSNCVVFCISSLYSFVSFDEQYASTMNTLTGLDIIYCVVCFPLIYLCVCWCIKPTTKH